MHKYILTLLLPGLIHLTYVKCTAEKDSLRAITRTSETVSLESELKIVKTDIIRLLKQFNNKEWQTFHLTIEAPPFTNRGFVSIPVFLDPDGNKLDLAWKGDSTYEQNVYNLIFQMNQKEIRNQVLFFTQRGAYHQATIFTSFSQNIEETFQSRLPEAMRGKTVPWFKTRN